MLSVARETIAQFLKTLGMDEKLRISLALESWSDLVGEPIARNAVPLKLRNKHLTIAVTASVWAQELELKKQELINRLNDKASANAIESIRFEVRPSVFKKKAAQTSDTIEPQAPPIELPISTELNANELFKSIEDESIRTAVKRAYLSSARLNLNRQQRGWITCQDCGVLYAPFLNACPICNKGRMHV